MAKECVTKAFFLFRINPLAHARGSECFFLVGAGIKMVFEKFGDFGYGQAYRVFDNF